MTVKTLIFAGTCFAIAAFIWATPAKATERNQPNNAQASAAAVALSSSTSSANSNAGGGAGGYVNVDSEKPAASSAIAPSVGTNNNCLIATPSSAAVNILFGGVSKTTGFHYSGLCLAYRMNDLQLAEKLMCLEDKNYAKLNANCAK